MQLAHHVRRPCAIAMAALLLPIAAVSAADLTLEPIIVSDVDILSAVPLAGGAAGILREGAIDFVQRDGSLVPSARAGESQKLFLGDGGDRIGVVTHREGAADFSPTATFELRDRSGALLWSMGETEDVTYSISKTGEVVGMSLNINTPKRNTLHFYGEGGVLEAEVSVPFLIGGQFDPDGMVFLALSVQEGLIAFDSAGNELWRIDGVRMSAATPGAERVAVFGDGLLRVVQSGEIIAKDDMGDLLLRRLSIAPDGSRVAVAGKHEVRIYDAGGLSLLNTIILEDENLSWTSIDLASDGGWLVAGVARSLGLSVPVESRHPDGEVRAYDASGNLVHRAQMEFPVWNIWTPTIKLDQGGTEATVTTRRALYRTVLP